MPEFARSVEEAEERYDRFKDVDPFPDISPALLNSADIADYVAATGMIYPFSEDAQHLKPASYEVPLKGPTMFWDEEGQLLADEVEAGKLFVLKQNSITFVTLEPMFRLPNYIAIRFNLRITNIYRGILLGTGPLIDPGFVGRLSVPLHNLTINDYPLMGGEGLIWMEFTKVSDRREPPDSTGIREFPSRSGTFFPLSQDKADPSHDVAFYTHKAWPAGAIRSSIPEEARKARESSEESAKAAETSAKTVESIRSTVFSVGLVALIIVVLTAAGSIASVFSLVDGSNSRIDSLDAQVVQVQATTAATKQNGVSTGRPVTGATPEQARQLRAVIEQEQSDSNQMGIWLAVLSVCVVLLIGSVALVGVWVFARRKLSVP